MSSQFDRPIEIKVVTGNSQPALLEGLDAWLRLGLISEHQVRDLSLNYLSCPLPEPVKATIPEPPGLVAVDRDFAVEVASSKPSRSPDLITRTLRSLVAELSVRWLLFLGVFMVVISSGVLAASQWEKFPPVGQYGVLFGYTAIFCLVSFWAGKQSNLGLTANTLQVVTLMLVPVNLWAMDSFKLWHHPLEWLTVAIATVLLTFITILLLKNRPSIYSRRRQQLHWLPIFNFLGLSYLHWGWSLPKFPLIALYIGTIGTSVITFYTTQHRQQLENSRSDNKGLDIASSLVIYALVMLLVRAIFVTGVEIPQLGLALGICGWVVAWLSQQEEGGMGRWGEGEIQETQETQETEEEWLTQNSSPSSPSLLALWESIGGILLLLGWSVSVGTVPWQATGVSLLSLWFFHSRLQRWWQKADLAVLLAIGLQTVWLVWRLLPTSTQEWAIATGTHLTGTQSTPWALLSLVLFPYVILIMAVSEWLDRASKPQLANFADRLALGLGTTLTAIALVNPTVRSLDLLLSFVTLAIVSFRRSPIGINLVYLSHIVGLLALASGINLFFPDLRREVWAIIMLAVMLLEWGASVLEIGGPHPASGSPLPSLGEGLGVRAQGIAEDDSESQVVETQEIGALQVWQRSAWHLGLVLAVVSFYLLWLWIYPPTSGDINPVSSQTIANCELRTDNCFSQYWVTWWLVAPITLTWVASRTPDPLKSSRFWLSTIALFFLQFLTFLQPEVRSIGLGVATGLMLVNTRSLRHLSAAAITIGFGLSFVAAWLWDGIPGLPELSIPDWYLVGAIAILILWLASRWLITRHGTLAAIYAQAADDWAIVLCGLEFSLLTVHSLAVYQRILPPDVMVIGAVTITMGAIAYRYWRQPNPWAFYGCGWGLELLTAEALGFGGYAIVNLSVANVGLGLLTQLLGEVWWRRNRLDTLPPNWHILPLIYAALSVVLRLDTFTSWTGFCSLGVALIAIGIGRRQPELKPLIYLGIIGISVSAYEILLYQLLQVPGGALGDGFVALAALGTTIVYAYRLLSPWLVRYLGLTNQELKIISHGHWFSSSCFLIAANFYSLASSHVAGLFTGIFLIQYALFQGRNHSDRQAAEIWVYLGILEVAALKIFWRDTPFGQLFAGELFPWKAPIACIWAYFFYILPWESWGWQKRPWQRIAYVLPLVFVWETREAIYSLGLVITAGFYILLCYLTKQVRLTYISLMLIDWALFKWFLDLDLSDHLWYMTPTGLSLLYVAQVDYYWQLPNAKESRHYLRLMATSTICVSALIFHQDAWIVPGIFSLIAIFAGLLLRVRAFLYVGTATFIANAFYQLVVLILHQPFFKWVVGLIVGIAFIWLAATFETRREQFTYLVRNWIAELEEWE
ncbi:MAG: hypothetical protein KME17_20830 [Cyanosarcina radialis HA8281-LM2]|jgi:hypothetical protein|nr:hypothetical protein [Cyanosarcina radialis HA8281-LM2]